MVSSQTTGDNAQALAESYTLKPNAIPSYFDAILDAQAPERFSLKFLENLGFTSTNDRLFVGILKDLGFLNRDGAPQTRYFEYLDRSQSKRVVADGIRDAFADLFAINTKANTFTVEEAKNKLRTLFAGKKSNLVISNIAKTFKALCDYADFTRSATAKKSVKSETDTPATEPPAAEKSGIPATDVPPATPDQNRPVIKIAGLQYHINIVLPETRDQGVFDAIFRSLRDHLG
jgi:hypothetical protein